MTTEQHKHRASYTDDERSRLDLVHDEELHGRIFIEPNGEALWTCRCGDRGGWFIDEAAAWSAFLDHEAEACTR